MRALLEDVPAAVFVAPDIVRVFDEVPTTLDSNVTIQLHGLPVFVDLSLPPGCWKTLTTRELREHNQALGL